MIKYFCDCCGQEVHTTQSEGRPQFVKTFTINGNTVYARIEIHHSINDVWNDGIICVSCILKMAQLEHVARYKELNTNG